MHRRAAQSPSCVPSSAIAQSARPKFFIARATAPKRFSGLRGRSRTIRAAARPGFGRDMTPIVDASSPARSDAARAAPLQETPTAPTRTAPA